MHRIVIIFLFMLISNISSFSQSKEDRNGNLIGYLEKIDLNQGKYKVWFKKTYKTYEPNSKVVKKIKKSLKNITVKTFFGTWCHDSKREVPRFFKIMEAAEFNLKDNFQMIGITRGKKTPDNLQEGYNIKHTPTFIFYEKGKEIGRYVEHPKETMEKDILKIISKKKYKHSYQK